MIEVSLVKQIANVLPKGYYIRSQQFVILDGLAIIYKRRPFWFSKKVGKLDVSNDKLYISSNDMNLLHSLEYKNWDKLGGRLHLLQVVNIY